jgi:O-antigen/teichoic acid export membrane protein
VLIATWYGAGAAGLFAVAQRVIGLPAALAGEAVGSAWFGTAAEIVREDRGSLRGPLVAVTRTLVLAGGAALAVVLVAAPPLFGPVFGTSWHGGGELLLALAPLHFSLFAAVPAGQALHARGRTDLVMVVATGRLLSPIAGIAGGHALGWSLTGSLALYAAAMASVSVLNAAMAWRVTGEPSAPAPGIPSSP